MPPTTSSLFNNPDADVILRSVDEVDFHIDLAILSAASSVFKDMSALPLPASEDTKDGRNIIPMQETSTTLEYLLQLIHPAMHPSLRNATLDTFSDILAAADKYQMSKIAPALEDALHNPRFFTEHASAFRVFAIASRSGMRELARVAARALLAFPPPSELLEEPPELKSAPATAYHRLLKYRRQCVAGLLPLDDASVVSSLETWWRDFRRESWTKSTPDWESCRTCRSGGDHNLTSWFIQHVLSVKAAFSRNPSAQTLLSATLLEPTIRYLVQSNLQCTCPKYGPPELMILSEVLAEKFEKQVVTIVYDP